MKSNTLNGAENYVQNQRCPESSVLPLHHEVLYLVSVQDMQEFEIALARGGVPVDFEAKLNRLAGGSLLHRSVEQNCRLFVALLQAAYTGSFKRATEDEKQRLLRVLAYVRKDDDAIPDYKPGGFLDDQREVRAAATELRRLLENFKNWRLRNQVPGMWERQDGVLERGSTA